MDDELDAIIDILNSDQNKYYPQTSQKRLDSQQNQQSEILNKQLQQISQQQLQIMAASNSDNIYKYEQTQLGVGGSEQEQEEEKVQGSANQYVKKDSLKQSHVSTKSSYSNSNSKSNKFNDSKIEENSQQNQASEHEQLTRQLKAIENRLFKKYMCFRPYIDPISIRPYKPPDRGLYFKMYNGVEARLIRSLLEDNGFREATKRDQEFTVMWACSNIKSQVYQSLTKYQKVNHFPKSTEITRKDCMYRLLARMREIHGPKHYGFVPLTFILPNELNDLHEAMQADLSKQWIVKPSSSSQGKGIFLTNTINDIPPKQSMIASQYIANPLCIDDYKFDLRIYVAITSINPLRVYIYDEGLTRFATVKYNQTSKKQSRYVHLTNYSLNKYNANFINNTDAAQDDQGSKWSLTALRRKFAQLGIDHEQLFKKIDDIILKTIIAGENVINNATEMFVPFSNNCFELLGFDVLIDDNLEPWLLEVNLSPSLNCDSPLDQKIKSNLIADLFNLAGMIHLEERQTTDASIQKKLGIQYTQAYGTMQGDVSAYTSVKNNSRRSAGFAKKGTGMSLLQPKNLQDMNKDEKIAYKETEEEMKRKGAFKRVFPTMDFPYYKQFFEEDRPLNYFLDAQFYSKIRTQNPLAHRNNEKAPQFMQSKKRDQVQVLTKQGTFQGTNTSAGYPQNNSIDLIPGKSGPALTKLRQNSNSAHSRDRKITRPLEESNIQNNMTNSFSGLKMNNSHTRIQDHEKHKMEMPMLVNNTMTRIPNGGANESATQKGQNRAPIPTGKKGSSSTRGAGLRQIGSMITQNTPSNIYQAAVTESAIMQRQQQ